MRPGIPGVSENIRVSSIIGRFLEHSRIYYFHNGGEEQIYIGSADLMPRNLNRRVEILFPVETPKLIRRLRDEILEHYLTDEARVPHHAKRRHVHPPSQGSRKAPTRQPGLVPQTPQRVSCPAGRIPGIGAGPCV